VLGGHGQCLRPVTCTSNERSASVLVFKRLRCLPYRCQRGKNTRVRPSASLHHRVLHGYSERLLVLVVECSETSDDSQLRSRSLHAIERTDGQGFADWRRTDVCQSRPFVRNATLLLACSTDARYTIRRTNGMHTCVWVDPTLHLWPRELCDSNRERKRKLSCVQMTGGGAKRLAEHYIALAINRIACRSHNIDHAPGSITCL
jgi:hypothetical protein